MTTVAALKNVTKAYDHGSSSAAVCGISLEVHAGELALLLGPSGSGKTTLLQLLAGLIRPTSGSVFLLGSDIGNKRPEELQSLRARQVGFVFQNFRLLDALTAVENVQIVAEFARHPPQEAREHARTALETVGIARLAGRRPGELSQGEQQRVAIARAIVNDAQLLLADEPTASLESTQGALVIDLLRRIARERNVCVVVASHDLRLVDAADRTFHLVDGSL